MTDFVALPDGWDEITYSTGPKRGDEDFTEELQALWASDDDKIGIRANEDVDARGNVEYRIVVQQYVESGPYSTKIQTNARFADNRKDVEEMAVEFMKEVNDGEHKLRVMGHEEWKEFVQFYCLSDSQLPDEMTGDELIGTVDNEAFDNDIDELPDDMDEVPTIQVDVFPRHYTEVDGYEPTEDDDGE